MARVAIEFDERQTFLAAVNMVSRRPQLKDLTCLQHEDTPEATTEALTKEVASKGWAKSDAVVVVRRSDVELRLLDVPPAPKNELPAMVKFVAKNEFASLNDSWVLDFVRLSGDAKEPGQVLAAGLSPEGKKRIEETIESAGMRLKQIVFRPLAVANYLASQLTGDDLRVLIEHKQDSANISLFNGRSMFATRTIRMVGDDLAKTYEREIKRTIGVANVAADKLTEILLLGEKEAVAPLGLSLTNSFSTPHRVIDPTADRTNGGKLKSAQQNHRFLPLLGATADQQDNATGGMDFLNPRKVEIQKADYKKWYWYAGGAAALLLLTLVICYAKLSSQTNQYAEYSEQLQKITDLNNGKTVRPAVADTMKKVGEIDDWVATGINWQDTLLAYSKHALTPDDTIIDSLIATQKGNTQLTVKVRIKNAETESLFVKELETRTDFVTTQKASKPLKQDKEFKIESRIEIKLERSKPQLIEEVNKRAEAFILEQRAARAAAAQTNTPSN